MSPHQVLNPIAGQRSVIVANIRKIATTARNCGNIWISSSDNRPVRRPRKRRRLKTYAASADTNTATPDAEPAMITEFRNQCAKLVSRSSLVKLSRETPVGTSWLEDRVPSGLSAEEITNRIGPSENTTATRPTACRQPTFFIHF